MSGDGDGDRLRRFRLPPSCDRVSRWGASARGAEGGGGGTWCRPLRMRRVPRQVPLSLACRARSARDAIRRQRVTSFGRFGERRWRHRGADAGYRSEPPGLEGRARCWPRSGRRSHAPCLGYAGRAARLRSRSRARSLAGPPCGGGPARPVASKPTASCGARQIGQPRALWSEGTAAPWGSRPISARMRTPARSVFARTPSARAKARAGRGSARAKQMPCAESAATRGPSQPPFGGGSVPRSDPSPAAPSDARGAGFG